MIVTDRFTYIHLHKSAGTFVNTFIQQYFPTGKVIGYHLPARYIPETHSHLPIIGCVRNPWDFYISWYFFQNQKKQSNALFMAVSEGKTLDFNRTMERLFSLTDNRPLLRQILEKLPDHFVSSGMNIPRSVMAKLYGSNLGLYSFLYQWMYRDAPSAPCLVKTEELEQGIQQALSNVGVSLSDDMLQFLNREGNANTSRHGHYADYYSQEIRDRVSHLDRELIAHHGYQFSSVG
jgi:hypothetical protein